MKKTHKCNICKEPFEGYGNNPWPFEGKVCCDSCNKNHVIPARILYYTSHQLSIEDVQEAKALDE